MPWLIKKIIDLIKIFFKFLTQLSIREKSKTLDKVNKSEPQKLIIEVKKTENDVKDLQKWYPPVPQNYFIVSQIYLNEDWDLYPKLGHHTGVDYGGHKQTNIPLFACADGEIIYREVKNSQWGIYLGNHVALYIPSIGKSFLYCHMAEDPPQLGSVQAGEQIGVMGNTGKSADRAIHLHLEGFHGKFKIAMRSFVSLDDIKTKTFDADKFIRVRL